MNTVEYSLKPVVFIFLELELHFFHFDALWCPLCEYSNVSFLHCFVTCMHFSALQILLVIKFEGASAFILFVSKKCAKRGRGVKSNDYGVSSITIMNACDGAGVVGRPSRARSVWWVFVSE